jgi:hypothetical protein
VGFVVLCAWDATAPAQSAPAFHTQPPALRQLPSVPHPELVPPPVNVPLFLPPALMPASARRRVNEFYVPLTLRRQRQRNLEPPDARDAFTLRTSSGILAQLSLAVQAELRATDNVNSAPRPLAEADTILEVTMLAHLTAGGSGALQPESSTDPEYYLDASYAPTSHQLLRAGTSDFLQHLAARAGYASQVMHTGVRIAYDEDLFASGSESSPEENFTVLEGGPFFEYRPSAKTTIHARGDLHRITLKEPGGNRIDRTAEAGIDCDLSVKTTAGLGAAVGHIDFDQSRFGTQDFEQCFAVLVWKATPTVNIRAQAGAEFRQFSRPVPKDSIVSGVALAALDWRPDERTRVSAAFRVQNQPSTVQNGALFRETRYAIEAQHDIGTHFYISGDAEHVGRHYDTGRDESELTLRPAIGYQLVSGALLDSVKMELFYQLRRHWNHGAGGDYTRNQAGMQMTVFF